MATAVGVLAWASLALRLATNGRYGFFRDELSVLRCDPRLDRGDVGQPPGMALIARLATALAGTSLVGIRVPAAGPGERHERSDFAVGWLTRAGSPGAPAPPGDPG